MVNKKAFFASIRQRLFDGELTPGQVNGIQYVLDNWVGKDTRHLGYMLGTVYHETDKTMQPIKEYGSDDYFNKRYGPSTKVGKSLGNIHEGDGAYFCGRGFVQITGRNNYVKFSKILGVDLVLNPNLAMTLDIAAKIMFIGMEQGLFTGKKLSDYLNGTKDDWIEARRIINGTDRAVLISGYGQKFFDALIEQ